MKISNSKKELASIISENGEWCDGAEWAAQDKSYCGRKNNVVLYKSKPPKPQVGESCFGGPSGEMLVEFEAGELVRNWHQTILSRAEYFHLYPAPDADGWIECATGESPVSGNQVVDVRFRDGETDFGHSSGWDWSIDGSKDDIIAYRLHKPEQAKSTAVGDDETNLAAKEELETMEYRPSIEQLMQIHCDRAHALGEKKAELLVAERQESEALDALKAACREAGFDISPVDNPHERQKPELVITDWRDLQVGDEIEVFDFDNFGDENPRKHELMSGVCVVMRTGACVHIELKSNLPKEGGYWNAQGVDKCKFRFIRRP